MKKTIRLGAILVCLPILLSGQRVQEEGEEGAYPLTIFHDADCIGSNTNCGSPNIKCTQVGGHCVVMTDPFEAFLKRVQDPNGDNCGCEF